MLADDSPPNLNPFTAAQPILSRQKSSQIGADNQSPEMNNQIQLQPSLTNGLPNQNDDRERVANFGWEQIKNGPLLPFIEKESKQYLAWYIVVKKVLNIILAIFSPDMLFCFSLKVTPMSKREALVFNEINRIHCDKGLVGDYVFTQGDAMITLEDCKKFVEYFYSCRNSMFHGVKDNNLFGFLRVDENTEIPFIWDGGQKIVPLFYFEGIDAEVLFLKDPWKLAYFKFCFKVQKIRQDLFKNHILQVIYFRDVEKLFPEGSTFELCWPKIRNRHILSFQMQVQLNLVNVPSGDGRAKKRLAEPATEVKAKKSKLGSPLPHLSASHLNLAHKTLQLPRSALPVTNQFEGPYTDICNYQPTTRLNPAQPSNQLEKPHFVTRGSLGPATSSVNRLEGNTQPTGFDCTRSDQSLSTITLASLAESNRPDSSSQDLGARREIAYQQQGLERSLQDSNDYTVTATKVLQQLASSSITTTTNMHHRFYTNRLVEEDFITNVPRRSPQVATSPGVQQTSPYMMAATEPFQRDTQSTNVVSTGSPTDSVQHKCMSYQSYPPQQSNMHQIQSINQFNNQERGGNTIGHLLNRSPVTVPNSKYIKPQHSVQLSSRDQPVRRTNTKLSKRHTISPQAGPVSQVCYSTANRPIQNSRLVAESSESIHGSIDSATLISHPNKAITICKPNRDCLDARTQQPSPQTSLLHVDQSNAHQNNSFTSLYQQGEVPVTLLEADIQQLTYEQSMLTENLHRNRKNLRLLKQKKSRQETITTHLQQNPVARNDNLSASKNQPYGNTLLAVSTDLQSVTSSQPVGYQQEFARNVVPVMQNSNVAVANVLVTDRNDKNYQTESAYSVITNKDNCETTKVKLIFLIPDHVLNIDTYKESYSVKTIILKKENVLGIRMSLLSSKFLINFRELASKTIRSNATSTLFKMASRFKVLYKLNYTQKCLWNVWSKGRCPVSGFLFDVFVEYHEAMSVLKCLSSTPL